MLRFFLLFLFLLSVFTQAAVVSRSFIVKLSDKKIGLKKMRSLNLTMKILEGSYVEINLGAPATSIYSLSDELTCYAIKDLIDEIDECSPNFIYSLNALADDPLVEYQWGLTGSGIRKEGRNAWDVTEGENVIVAVTDTGVDYNHPDLRDNIAVNGDEIPENNVDDDGNGFVDDWKGWNSVNNNGDPMDLHGHGTHVAGIVSAAKNNIGVVGIAPQAKILPVKVLNNQGWGTLSWIIQGLNYIKRLKQYGFNIRVVNASWGGGGYNEVLANLIGELKSLGIVFVAAAGNSASNNDREPTYPANYNGVVAVAATDPTGSLSFYSNYGDSVHVAAPGSQIVSTLPNQRFGSLSGTSMAAPHVSGAFALYFSVYPGAYVDQAVSDLMASCEKPIQLTRKIRNGCSLTILNFLDKLNVPVPEVENDTFRLTRNLVSLRPNLNFSDAQNLEFSHNDEGQVSVALADFAYNKLNAQLITVSSNLMFYFNQLRNPYDFLPGEQFKGVISNAISFFSNDWVIRSAKARTSESNCTVWSYAHHYNDERARITSLVRINKDSSFRVSYSLNKHAFDVLKDELSLIFFGNTEDKIYSSMTPRFREASYHFAPSHFNNVVVNDLRLRKREGGLVVLGAGAGSGTLYGHFYVGSRKCPRRTAIGFVSGSAARLSLTKKLNSKIEFRLRLPNLEAKRAIYVPKNSRKLYAKLSLSKVEELCSALNR